MRELSFRRFNIQSPDGNSIRTDRSVLLDCTVWFVEEIIRIDGIIRVALIGSICTNKRNINDIDILITIRDGMDITRIATQKRKLQGRIQRGSLGADVFLAENGKYIGRPCNYKKPWVRVVCASNNNTCDLDRPFLCDTSRNIRLSNTVINDPPIILWPEATANITIPHDIKKRWFLQSK